MELIPISGRKSRFPGEFCSTFSEKDKMPFGSFCEHHKCYGSLESCSVVFTALGQVAACLGASVDCSCNRTEYKGGQGAFPSKAFPSGSEGSYSHARN